MKKNNPKAKGSGDSPLQKGNGSLKRHLAPEKPPAKNRENCLKAEIAIKQVVASSLISDLAREISEDPMTIDCVKDFGFSQARSKNLYAETEGYLVQVEMRIRAEVKRPNL